VISSQSCVRTGKKGHLETTLVISQDPNFRIDHTGTADYCPKAENDGVGPYGYGPKGPLWSHVIKESRQSWMAHDHEVMLRSVLP
jgi:hypothetical protein